MLLLLASLSSGFATKVTVSEIPCPVGSGRVKVYEKQISNAMGGFDSDLASYSTKGQFRTHAISTCPSNMLSMYGNDMQEGIEEADRARVLAVLEHARSIPSKATDPQVWERYRIAAEVYRALGWSSDKLGDLYLEASWTARDEAVGVFVGLEGPKDADAKLAQAKQALGSDLSAENKKTLLYNMARIAHRAGYNEARDEHLAAFAATGSLTDAEKKALARFRHITIEVEPQLQDLAITEYKRALDSTELSGEDRIRVQYLLADLLRRRDRPSEALPHYTAVMNADGTPDDLREMAIYLSRKTSSAGQ